MSTTPSDLQKQLESLQKENALLKQQLSQSTFASKSESKSDDPKDPSLWSPSFVSKYDHLIFDCDGVVWRGSDAIPGARESLEQLQAASKTFIFLSNNSTKTLETYQSKFTKLFSLQVPKNRIFTSAVATAAYLNSISTSGSTDEAKQAETPRFNKKDDKILLIGSIGLYTLITDAGFNVLWTSRETDFPSLRASKVSALTELELDRSVKIVVCGMDQSHNYNDICVACRYLNECGARLVGSNDDTTFPAKQGLVLAGTGSLLASVRATSPRPEEMVVCGKPHKLLFDLIRAEHTSIQPEKTLMVGDRLNTDIAFGKKCGLDTLLVLSGVTTKDALEASEMKPDYYLSSIEGLCEAKK